MLKYFKSYFIIFFFIFSCFGILAESIERTEKRKKSIFKFRLTDVSDNFLGKTIENIVELQQTIQKTKAEILEEYQTKINILVKKLNQLRDIYYQYHIVNTARELEGTNLYHHYRNGNKNDEDNTCVVGWCVAMSATRHPRFRHLTNDKIKFFPLTLAKEKGKLDKQTKYNPYYYSANTKKLKANLEQKKAKYINVQKVIDISEGLGFVPIDLDLAQTGDFVVQYYKKPRLNMTFGPQHISIVHEIIHYQEGRFELRDWHEGIEEEPFIYRTGHNLKSSHNNIFYPENVYYGFQSNKGKPRNLQGKNPNICQGYAYFGNNTEDAKKIINKINHLRGSMYVSKKLFSLLNALGI